jgi:biopolymer transport protein ExbB
LKVEINLTKQKNMDLLILQTDGNVVESTQKTLSIIELLLKGGWLMIPMAVLSFITIYIFVERYLTISKANRIDDKFMPAIRDYVINGNIEAAKALCRQTDTPVARMIEKGISRIGKPLKNIEVAIENVGKLEVYKMERGLPLLATISGIAPMLGFFGTVTGIIEAFFAMANAGNNIEVGLLANGIYVAMITTAVGLAIGIPAYFAYNLLVSKVDKVVNRMEAISMEFIDLLQEPA